ncbi:Cmx/CmrA family chloramphenicol efflux MFS transporter [Saccharomonospora xinjiangensis]|uniref:Cmx/CmrA family chloramphenicol efflux MFS transporter n=1 Tax=Saccharomonospora xinjiangensis TaxID=75294 RepID=UPI003510C918
MPHVLYLLGLAVFAQGTSEFMLSGLVAGIANDLDVSVATAGLLTSAFAVGMIVGAPAMATLSLCWSRRKALLGFLGTFLVVHVVGALSTDFAVLVATRVVGALANAGFLAVALASAAAMVAPESRARATSILLSGTTLACVVGVPAGAVLGQLWGWRAAFWAVAALSAPALVAITRTVPDGGAAEAKPSARSEWSVLRDPKLLLTLLAGALVNGATFASFTFLGPIATEALDLPTIWVPVVLALFGLGAFAGVTVAGRTADAWPGRVLVGGGAALVAGWVFLAFPATTMSSPVPALTAVFLQGALSFAVGATLIARALAVAERAPTVGSGLATAAFNVGAAVGPWLGGIGLAGGSAVRAPLFVSTLLALAGVALAAWTLHRTRSAQMGAAGLGQAPDDQERDDRRRGDVAEERRGQAGRRQRRDQ